MPDPKNTVWREWKGQKWHHSAQLSFEPAPAVLPQPEDAFTPLPHPQFHTQLGQGAKKAPGSILLPSPWHISSQARLGCRLQQGHKDAGSSCWDIRRSPELGNLKMT